VQGLRAEHQIDLWCPLAQRLAFLAGHAAADPDHHARPPRFQRLPHPQLREHFFLRLFADRAGVEQQHVRLGGIVGALQTAGRPQAVRHPGGVVFVHLAAVGLDVQFADHR